MTSWPLSAYLSLFLRIRMSGRHSLVLWGPGDGFGACDGSYNGHFSKNTPSSCTGTERRQPTAAHTEPDDLKDFVYPAMEIPRQKNTNHQKTAE